MTRTWAILATLLLCVPVLPLSGCGKAIPPLIVGVDNRTLPVGGLLEAIVRATVPGTLSLADPYPKGVQLVPLSGETATALVRWIPLASNVGMHTLTLVLDAEGQQVTESFIVTVLPSEIGRPQFQGTPYNLLLDRSRIDEITMKPVDSVTLNLVVKDDDDTSVVLEVVPGTELEGATLEPELDGKTAVFTFKPSAAQFADRCSFGTQLRARDPKGMEARAGVFIEVRNGCGQEPGLLINELLYDPPTGSDVNQDGTVNQVHEEFIEIVNIAARPIELGGATLSDTTKIRFTFPTPTTLQPKQAAVVFGGGTPKNFPADVKVFASSDPAGLELNNGGDTAYLRSSDGSLIDSVTYPSQCLVIPNVGGCSSSVNQSINRQMELSRTTPFVRHEAAAGLTPKVYFSPGRRANGKVF